MNILTRQKTMPDLAEFMTTEEAAKLLGFNVRSIPYMIKTKTLEGVKFGRAWLVSRKSVKEYLTKTDGMSKNDPRRKSPK
ncbi:MAG: helix-turn-helix domain-containing protein [Anaerolineales bacterium]|nr:helix-turn-helix domain-containing protein [Anaerolineales bacterium]